MKEFWEKLKNLPTWQKVLLAVAALAVVGIALYVRSQQSGSAGATTAPTTGSSGLLNGTGSYDIYGNPLNGNQTPTSGGTTPTPGNSGTSQLNIRGPGKQPNYDPTHNGVPLRSSPGGSGSILSLIPWNSSVSVTGSPVQGSLNEPGGSTLWFPVSYGSMTGYVSGWDIIPGAARNPTDPLLPNRTVNA